MLINIGILLLTLLGAGLGCGILYYSECLSLKYELENNGFLRTLNIIGIIIFLGCFIYLCTLFIFQVVVLGGSVLGGIGLCTYSFFKGIKEFRKAILLKSKSNAESLRR